MRGRTRSKGPNPLTRSFESNGPDVKIRGTAQHIADKYSQLARDAQSSSDPVSAENYLQHAEHYYRLIAAAQEQYRQQYGTSQRPFDEDGDDGDDDGASGGPYGYGERTSPGHDDMGEGGYPPYANGGDRQGQQARFDRQERYSQGNGQDRNGQDRNGYDRGDRQDRPQQQRTDRGYDRSDRNQERNARSNNGGQDRSNQDRQGQDRQGSERYGQDRTGQDRAGQDRAGQERAGQERGGQERTAQDRGGAQDRNGPDRASQDRASQDRPGQDRGSYDRNSQAAERRDRPARAEAPRRDTQRSEARTPYGAEDEVEQAQAGNLPAFLTNPVRSPVTTAADEGVNGASHGVDTPAEAGAEPESEMPRPRRKARVRRPLSEAGEVESPAE